jgi:hypothetical protein
MIRTLLCLAITLAATAAAANEPEVDWQHGLIRVSVTRIADLAAPNATIARVRAERIAKEQARRRLIDAADKVKLANGKTVGAVARGDIRRRLDALEPLTLRVDYQSDGTTTVIAALPLEAVRIAIGGSAEAPAKSEPAAVVVDARKFLKAPALALAIKNATLRYEGPALFVSGAAAASKQFGDKIIEVEGKRLDDAAVEVDKADAVTLASQSGAVLVFLIKTP